MADYREGVMRTAWAVPGENIDEYIGRIHSLVAGGDEAIEFRHNDVQFIVTPRSTLHSIRETYDKIHRKNRTVLREAEGIVVGQREADYGPPEENLGAIADAWTVYLRRRYGADIPALDARGVAMLMVLMKAVRDANRPKRDNLVDIAGYVRAAEMVDEAVR